MSDAVDQPKPAPKPKKPAPKKAPVSQVDWNYWHTGLLVGLYVILLWPSLKPILLFVLDGKRPVPVVPEPVVPPVNPDDPVIPLPDPPEYSDTFKDVSDRVPEWLLLVASPDVEASKKKYSAALLATAEALKKDSTLAVMPTLRDAIAKEIGDDGYLDWSLFTIRIVETFKALRSEGRIDGSAASHAAVLLAVRSGLGS